MAFRNGKGTGFRPESFGYESDSRRRCYRHDALLFASLRLVTRLFSRGSRSIDNLTAFWAGFAVAFHTCVIMDIFGTGLVIEKEKML
jgi:hypothetical protein